MRGRDCDRAHVPVRFPTRVSVHEQYLEHARAGGSCARVFVRAVVHVSARMLLRASDVCEGGERLWSDCQQQQHHYTGHLDELGFCTEHEKEAEGADRANKSSEKEGNELATRDIENNLKIKRNRKSIQRAEKKRHLQGRRKSGAARWQGEGDQTTNLK
eukprot:4670870-Pleurochrysis_carterae.AAC.1